MSDDAIQLHEASLALLEDPGIRIEHEQIATTLWGARATDDHDADVLRLPYQMVDEYLASVRGQDP